MLVFFHSGSLISAVVARYDAGIGGVLVCYLVKGVVDIIYFSMDAGTEHFSTLWKMNIKVNRKQL